MATNAVDHTQAGLDAMTLNSADTELNLSDFLDLERFADILSTPASASPIPIDTSINANNDYSHTPSTLQHNGRVDIHRERESTPKPSQYNQHSFLANVTMARSPRFFSLVSPYSLNPKHTMDNWPAFQFVQPLTPTVSSRSPSPISSTASTVIDVTSPQISKAVTYIRQNLQREYDEKLEQRLVEVEYRLRKEYLDKLDVQLQLERKHAEEEYRTHFEKLLQERMKEVVVQFNGQCDANRTEFEEILKERMAEVQVICNEMVEKKDREVTRLKAKLKTAAAISQTNTRKHGSAAHLQDQESEKRQTGRTRTLRRRISSDSESEYVPSEIEPRSIEPRSPAPTPGRVENVAKRTSDLPCLKDVSIEDLAEKFFRLQLIVSIQHAQLEQVQEDLTIYREKLEKHQCGARGDGRIQQPPYRDSEDRLDKGVEQNREREVEGPGATDSEVSIMPSDRVSTPPRLLSSSPRWRPYPSPTPSPLTQPVESATVHSRKVSQTPSPLGSPFETPPSSVMRSFARNPLIWSGGPSSSQTSVNSFDRCVDSSMTSEEEEIDELQDDEDLDEPWIISR